MKKTNKKSGIKEFSDILSAMTTYLSNNDHNFHNRLFTAYCNSCQSITMIGGDYTIFAGRDCGGDHYKTEKSPEACIKCHSPNFIKLIGENYGRNYSSLIRIYRKRTSQIIIEGINNGLKRMNFPSLYNPDLPKIANRWKRLKKETKIKQIKKNIKLTEEIAKAKVQVNSLEELL